MIALFSEVYIMLLEIYYKVVVSVFDFIGWLGKQTSPDFAASTLLFIIMMLCGMGMLLIATIVESIKSLWFNFLSLLSEIFSSPITWLIIISIFFGMNIL